MAVPRGGPDDDAVDVLYCITRGPRESCARAIIPAKLGPGQGLPWRHGPRRALLVPGRGVSPEP
eukprot:3348313-Alexandrium_andersonii.AAC.1